MQIGITEAKAKLSALIAAAERGEEIIITRRGKPVARIVAIAPKRLASRIDLAEDAARELLDALDALRKNLGLNREEEPLE